MHHDEIWHMGDLLGFEERHKEPELQELVGGWIGSLSGVGNGSISLNCDL